MLQRVLQGRGKGGEGNNIAMPAWVRPGPLRSPQSWERSPTGAALNAEGAEQGGGEKLFISMEQRPNPARCVSRLRSRHNLRVPVYCLLAVYVWSHDPVLVRPQVPL